MADTHLMHERCPSIPTPEVDLLIHAGDATLVGNERELQRFFAWFSALPARHKIFVAGNHDWLFQEDPFRARTLVPPGVIYLEDDSVEIDGVRIWGSPWQPEFQDWAFNLPRGPRLREKWDRIPAGVDIVVTHGPPMGVLDRNYEGVHVGCEDLRDVLTRKVKPRLHVFGHIHHGYGTTSTGRTVYVNAAVCDESYRPFNDPVLLEVGPSGPYPPEVLHEGHAVRSVAPHVRDAPLW